MNDLHPGFPVKWVMALVAVSFLFLQSGCRSVQRFPGQRLALPASADGHLEDFSRKITSQLFENGMMVGLGNDEQNLYVFFTPDIRRGRRHPGRALLTVWLDARGGKAEKLGLVHVSGTAAMTPPPGGRTGTRAGEQKLLKIIDRRQGRESFIVADGSSGLALRLDSDWGDFVYQLRIPFQGAGAWPGLDVKPNQVIAVGLSWKIERPRAPEKESMDRPRGGPGGRGSGGGKPGRGGMPPDMEGGSGGAYAGAPASKRKVWLRTTIAGK